jgi:uncharacterized protein YcgI (DUF1989 family)
MSARRDNANFQLETDAGIANRTQLEQRGRWACVVVLSACPQDLLPVNGLDCTPKPVAYEVRSSSGKV